MIIRACLAASRRAAAAPLIVSGSRQNWARAGAGGAAAAPWTSVLIRVAAARARGATSTCWQQHFCLQGCFSLRASSAALATRRERLYCATARVVAINAIVRSHLTKVLHLPLAPASVSLRPSLNMIPGTMRIRRDKRSRHKTKSPHAPHTLFLSFANALPGAGVGSVAAPRG